MIRANLGALGLDVDVKEFPPNVMFEKASTKGEPYDIITAQWIADWADPSTFLNVLLDQRITPRGNVNLARFVDARFAGSSSVSPAFPAQPVTAAYEALSVELARDAAPWVVLCHRHRRATSSRPGSAARCSIPFYGIDLAALCIRK